MTLTPPPNAKSTRGGLDPPPGLMLPAAAMSPPVAASPLAPTIFHQPWWLDAVSAGIWQEVKVESGGRVIGRFPYVFSRRFGQTTIGMPILTHFLGPAIDEGEGSVTTRQLKRITITRDLIAALPPANGIWVKFHRGVTDTLAFQHAGYRNEVQFTCEIAPAGEAALWAGLRDTARRVIRRAAGRLRIAEIAEPEAFFDFYDTNIRARGLRNTYPKACCLSTIAACADRKAGRVLGALDQAGRLEAAIFTIWDGHSEYYLMSTRRPDADNGATSLLMWAAILHAASHGLAFDMDGVSTSGDMQFLTRFGGVIQPRYFVHRSTLPLRVASAASDRLRLLLGERSAAAGRAL